MTLLMVILGQAISTQIVEVFLTDERQVSSTDVLQAIVNGMFNGGASGFNGTDDVVPDVDEIDDIDRINGTATLPTDIGGGLEAVQIIYLIAGALDVAVAIVCLLMCMWSNSESEEDAIELIPESTEKTKSNAEETLDPCSRQGCLLLVVISTFTFIARSHNIAFNFLLFTYIYEYRGWSVNASCTLLLVNYTTRFVAGIVMVPVSRWVSPTKLQIFNLAMMIVSGVLMVMAAVVGDTLTVVGTVLEGAGTSNIHPTTITLLEDTIHVVAWLMALLSSMVGASTVVGFVIGALLYYIGAWSFPVTMLILSLVSMALFIVYKVIVVYFIKIN